MESIEIVAAFSHVREVLFLLLFNSMLYGE